MPTRPASLLFAAALAVLPARAIAQRSHRYQFAAEVGLLSAGLSYSERVRDSRLSLGVGLWGAWEVPNTFDHPVFEARGVLGFARQDVAPWLHVDLGPALLRYQAADDCSRCSGTFWGVRTVTLFGSRSVLVGPEAWIGWASDAEHGTDFGMIWGLEVRFVLGWGR